MAKRAIKLVAYNILDGGAGRLDPIFETLRFLDADVVGLCEADDPKGVGYLADKLGMEFVVAAGGGGHGVALLSRWPIRSFVNLSVVMPELDRGAIEAVVGTDHDALRIVVAHLDAGQTREDEESRMRQVARLLGHVEEGPAPTVLMGDFNAASPVHPFDFEAASPRVRDTLVARGLRRQDHDVVEMLISRGWVDACHRARPDSPVHSYTTGFPTTRFDYIWLQPGWAGRLIDAGVERGGFAAYCSDHYPVWAELCGLEGKI